MLLIQILLALNNAENVLAGERSVDVVVIGAGQAGMAAAHRLISLGRSVHVLEATDHVGGRTRNFDIGTGKFDTNSDNIYEVGGTWLSEQHTASLKLCKELGVEVFNASFTDDAPIIRPSGDSYDFPWWYYGADYPEDQMKKVNSTIFHSAHGRFQFATPQQLKDNLDNETWMQLDKAEGIISASTAAFGDQCWDAMSCGPDWQVLDMDSTAGTLGKILNTSDAKQILANTIHDRNAEDPEQVGFLYNMFSFAGCNTGGADMHFRVRGGTQAIAFAIAAKLGKNVTLNSPVEAVDASSKDIQVRTRDGLHFRTSAVVVTGPPPTVLGIDFHPALPGVQAQLLQRMPMGTSLKYAAVYKKGPWWRNLGLAGDILVTSLPRNLSVPGTDEPLFYSCFDHSPFSREFGIIACFIEGRQNLYFMTLPDSERQSIMRTFLRLSFSDVLGESPIDIVEPDFFVPVHNWADQPYARGAYTSYFPPGVMSVPEYWAAYRQVEKLPNVFLAGADYYIGFGNGWIEGAILSGQEAANLAHSRLQGLPDVIHV